MSSAGLHTTVQPAASAGAILRAIMAAGKFHGVMAAITPTGSCTASMRRPGTGAGILATGAGGFFGKPLDVAGGVLHLAAAFGRRLAPALAADQAAQVVFVGQHQVVPALEDLGAALGFWRQLAKAACMGGLHGWRASSAPPSGTSANTWSVAGSVTARRRPSRASHHSPPR